MLVLHAMATINALKYFETEKDKTSLFSAVFCASLLVWTAVMLYRL
jgi:hypothetical protein